MTGSATPPSIRPTPSFARPVDSERACLYVTLINNTVDVWFPFRALYSLFYTRPPRWCGTTDTWRRWLLAKNATRVKLVSRTLHNPAPCYARVKILLFLPILAPRLRSLAIRHKQFYGPYVDSLVSRSAPYIIWLFLLTIPPLLLLIPPYFSLTPNSDLVYSIKITEKYIFFNLIQENVVNLNAHRSYLLCGED